MSNNYKRRGIVLINKETGERKEFSSISSAASFLGINFSSLQKAAITNGVRWPWRVYESAESIRQHIKELEEQLKIVDG